MRQKPGELDSADVLRSIRAVESCRFGALMDPRTKLLVPLASALILGACGAQDAATMSDFDQLQTRLEDLERTHGRMHIRVQDTEERLFLLQDRVEANRINMSRRDTQSIQRLRAERPTVRYESPVTSAAPPPRMDIDPLVPNLPVQRLGPALTPHQVEELEEVVIDQAEFDARFGTETAAAEPARRRNRSTAPTPRAQPPVDVGGHRLPTVDNDNRPVRPTSGSSSSAGSTSSPRNIYDRAVGQFHSAEYADALSTLNEFVLTSPEPDYMDNALFWMGECLYGLGRYNEALGFFQRVVSEYPDGNKVPDSLLKEALTYERLQNDSRAREILATLVETYPTTDAADRAQQRLRDLE